jgi:sugar phosphate isomerase/epimerase
MRNPAAVRSAGGGGTLNAVTLLAANENALAARALWYKVPMRCTRREFNALALSAVPASLLGAIDKPDSKVAGVQIGLNVPYNFGDPKMSGDEILRRCIQLGVSAVELRSQPVEAFLGVPRSAAMDKMDRVKDFRRTYEDAGVRIEIVKFDDIYALSDAQLDYCFTLARTLGARAISCEISVDDTKRLGSFADKHDMMVGYHGHEKTTPEMWEKAFAYARHNGANVDLGHFVAGNNMSPLPFITRYHDRITHVHVKDRRRNNGATVPFGDGDTPILETLRAIRDNKWNIQATIEFEYPVPPGSDRMAEMAKCITFCRNALNS